ncbi:hypothetical protein FRC12_014069 [Ceratobasidium sp. 428]|nr:hypothetical protein FRC12_014069 [Ceratobasidium sp. 428]
MDAKSSQVTSQPEPTGEMTTTPADKNTQGNNAEQTVDPDNDKKSPKNRAKKCCGRVYVPPQACDGLCTICCGGLLCLCGGFGG